LLAIVIASAAFVAVRNTELAEHQVELAARATAEVVAGRDPLPGPHVMLVGAPHPSKAHPFLQRRTARTVGGDAAWAPLIAATGPDAKLFYDAANRFDRGEPVSELMRDGSGRAIVAARVPASNPSGQKVIAIALTEPARPQPYPFLVMIGVLGLGAAFAAAGALIGGRARHLGLFVGIAALAIPCILWRTPVAATLIVLVGIGFALAQHRRITDRVATGLVVHRTALAFLAPAGLSMLVLVAAPFIIGILLGFYDHHHGTWTFVGLSNFGEILSGGGRPLDDPLNFWFILGVTVLWTLANVLLHVTIGVTLALALSRTWIRGKGVFRMLFILPWAIPNYITALIWKGMFDNEYGAVNSIFHSFGLDGVSWFSSWATSFSANVITNTWLGFPFMMVVALGAIESIPKELYEAAAVDGANSWARFRHITLPHLRPALGPAVALGAIWTFNMFNVIFLVSGGQPGGSTNILVTDAYRWAFERGERYGMSAAYATIIFLVLLLWTVFGTRIVRSKSAAGDES
ncbi:MAG: sugar ABC transporter permease, partial [Proteobacteria bacterium]|nr:sugar ABC transporter permease [Pseudomonadota bacterium]